jgi:nicotinamide mononucleotide adenylyltransferase
MASIGIFQGRFQPISKTHRSIIANMDYDKVYVVIVEGAKSSLDKKNFLSFADRVELFHVTNPKAKVIHSTTGFIPDIISSNKLNPDNDDVYIHAGSDRIDGYVRQFKAITDYKVIPKEIVRFPEDVSATKIRQALLDNDYGAYKSMIADGLDNERWFAWLRKKIMVRNGIGGL